MDTDKNGACPKYTQDENLNRTSGMYCPHYRQNKLHGEVTVTVLPAKSVSDVMFCLQCYQGLRMDRSLVYLSYPQDRINTQLIYPFALAQVDCISLCFT